MAAVTVTNRRLGYASQGPGGLSQRKPDVAGYSHFSGSGVRPVDAGTSAAAPVVAGVVAALRQKVSIQKRPPAALKALLQRTATDLENNGWDSDLGYGVVNAAQAVKHLKLLPPKPALKPTQKTPKPVVKAAKKKAVSGKVAKAKKGGAAKKGRKK